MHDVHHQNCNVAQTASSRPEVGERLVPCKFVSVNISKSAVQ